MVILYQKKCEGCNGNRSSNLMQQVCNEYQVKFDRRTVSLWDGWQKEAEQIMNKTQAEYPFFYNEKTGEILPSDSLISLQQIYDFVRRGLI